MLIYLRFKFTFDLGLENNYFYKIQFFFCYIYRSNLTENIKYIYISNINIDKNDNFKRFIQHELHDIEYLIIFH